MKNLWKPLVIYEVSEVTKTIEKCFNANYSSFVGSFYVGGTQIPKQDTYNHVKTSSSWHFFSSIG